MLNKKLIALAGASILVLALLTGVTYAWFTNIATPDSPGTIVAGNLGIEFNIEDEVDEAGDPLLYYLYPVLTLEDGTPKRDGAVDDVVEKTITLNNDSSRQVLVRVSGIGMKVMGSQTETSYPFNVIEETRGNYELTDTSALRFLYTPDDLDIKYMKVEGLDDNIYILLPDGASKLNVGVQIWIDGENGGNEYQNATITFSEMTAMAVQYRKAAIEYAFPELSGEDLLDFEGYFGDFE